MDASGGPDATPREHLTTDTVEGPDVADGPSEGGVRINRTQALVLGFVLLSWVGLVVILAVAPKLLAGGLTPAQSRPVLLVAFLVAITAFLGVLGVGVVQQWRWLFWLVLVAFLAGVLRVPAAALELVGALPASGPAWYVLLQAAIGLVQCAVGLAMVSGFRRAGVWGPFGGIDRRRPASWRPER